MTNRRRALALVATGLAAITLVVALGHGHWWGKPDPVWKQVERTWNQAQRANPTPGTMYFLSRDCKLTVRSAPVADRPMVPVGTPIRTWKLTTSDTNSPAGKCHKADPNETGVHYRVVNDPAVLPGSTNGPWVFSTLGPEKAFQARLIPSLPLTTYDHPQGEPGYFYVLSNDCTKTVETIPVTHRPFFRITSVSRHGPVETVEEMVVSNGNYAAGKCGILLDPPPTGSDQWIWLKRPDGADIVVSFGDIQWVYSTLAPEAATKAGIIPALQPR